MLSRLRNRKSQSANTRDDLIWNNARSAVGRIVGRDTAVLDKAGIIRATVETVAENFSDGVVAPLFYMVIGGAPLALAYKAVNTMDSMIGYKNKKYLHFGNAAAKLDDRANFFPSRLAALFLILSARICQGSEAAKRAFKIWKRDRLKHPSPNSAQTESVMAGALGVRLLGPTSYFGKLYKKEWIDVFGGKLCGFDFSAWCEGVVRGGSQVCADTVPKVCRVRKFLILPTWNM